MPRPCIARVFSECTPVREVSWKRNIAQTSKCASDRANVEGGFLDTHSFTYADSARVDMAVSRSNNSSDAPIVISVLERKAIFKLQALYREPRDALRTPVGRELMALDHKLDFDQVEYVRAVKKTRSVISTIATTRVLAVDSHVIVGLLAHQCSDADSTKKLTMAVLYLECFRDASETRISHAKAFLEARP